MYDALALVRICQGAKPALHKGFHLLTNLTLTNKFLSWTNVTKPDQLQGTNTTVSAKGITQACIMHNIGASPPD